MSGWILRYNKRDDKCIQKIFIFLIIILIFYFQENIAKLMPRSATRQCAKIPVNASKDLASHSTVIVAKVENL